MTNTATCVLCTALISRAVCLWFGAFCFCAGFLVSSAIRGMLFKNDDN